MPHRSPPPDIDTSVGLHAHTDFVTLCAEQTAGDALAALRGRTDLSDRIVYLYVTGAAGALAGVVPVRRLLTAQPGDTLGAIMLRDVVTVSATTSVAEACEEFLRHRLLALPVVDGAGRMTGIVDVSLFADEVMQLERRRQVEGVFQLIGVHLRLGRAASPVRAFRDRFPWLFCNVASGLACAWVAGRHEPLLARFTLLALFLTVVLAVAESVGMQSMTLTLQGLPRQGSGGGGRRDLTRRLLRELGAAGLLAIGCGVLVGGVALAWKRSGAGAVTVGGTIAVSILAAGFFGFAVPSAIHALRADPKIAAGPVVLAASDLTALLTYFTLASWLLH